MMPLFAAPLRHKEPYPPMSKIEPFPALSAGNGIMIPNLSGVCNQKVRRGIMLKRFDLSG